MDNKFLLKILKQNNFLKKCKIACYHELMFVLIIETLRNNKKVFYFIFIKHYTWNLIYGITSGKINRMLIECVASLFDARTAQIKFQTNVTFKSSF